MPTSLTTSKMNPALAARVEAAVRGRGRGRSPRVARRITSLARFALVAAVALAVYTILTRRQGDRRDLEAARAALLDDVARQRAALGDVEGALGRVEAWVRQLSGASYEGDVTAAELRAPGALREVTSRSMVYVRGPLGGFDGQALAETAAASSKDALSLCLVDPPAARTEAALFARVRVAYVGGAALEAGTPNVRRLHDAIVGAPLLATSWSDGVRAASSREEVERLRRAFGRAALERAGQAAKASVLLVAVDEPGGGEGPTELDGERPHAVRVALVDLDASKVLLRARRQVDPGWISASRRATYASGFDGCALAFDLSRL